MTKYNITVDVNKLVDFMKSGDADEGERKWFNDWEARDQYANQQGTFTHGRRSAEAKGVFGITIGRNYYAWSALGAMDSGIRLDSNDHYVRLWNNYSKK